MGLVKVKELLPILFKVTTEQIYLDSFKLVEHDFKLIFDHSQRVKQLWIVNWEVSNLGEDFFIHRKKEYEMEYLDLYWTWIQDDEDYLNLRKTMVLLEAIKDSKIKDSLEVIHVCEEEFNKKDLRKLIKKWKLDVQLIHDSHAPKPLK